MRILVTHKKFLPLYLIASFILTLTCCEKEAVEVQPPAAQLPTVETRVVTRIETFSAYVTGNVTDDGGAQITRRGMVWAKIPNPSVESGGNDYRLAGTGTGPFSGDLFNLSPQTTYYVRAFATNTAGTSYGKSVYFTTRPILVINPFVSINSDGEPYHFLQTRPEREAFIKSRLDEDWVNTIPYSTEPWWVCENYASQLTINCHNLGNDIRLQYSHFTDERLFNWYRGRNVDSIKLNGGTLVDVGKLGIPMGKVTLYDTSHVEKGFGSPVGLFGKEVRPKSDYFGHSINFVVTGNDLTNWDDITFIEPQLGNEGGIFPLSSVKKDCDLVTLIYPCTYQENGKNYFKYAEILKFRISDGKPELIWINEDPSYEIVLQRAN